MFKPVQFLRRSQTPLCQISVRCVPVAHQIRKTLCACGFCIYMKSWIPILQEIRSCVGIHLHRARNRVPSNTSSQGSANVHRCRHVRTCVCVCVCACMHECIHGFMVDHGQVKAQSRKRTGAWNNRRGSGIRQPCASTQHCPSYPAWGFIGV